MILRMAKALAPGLDAKAAAEELKERVLEELDYELEAQNQRAFARGYRGHPFIYVPDVVTRLSTERVLVTEWVDGVGFDEVKQLPQEERDRFGEIVFRFCFGSIYHLQHFNADAHPGQLPADGRRQGGVPRLRDDQAARQGPDRARDRRARGDLRRRPAARSGSSSKIASSAAISSWIWSWSRCFVIPKSRNATRPFGSSR